MLTKGFFQIVNRSPKGRRVVFRWLFEYLARKHRHLSTWTQMNYGYAEATDSGHTIPLGSRDETERYCHQLYHHVGSGADLAGKDIVEVSCGRGGGAAFVHSYFNADTLTGIDIAQGAIDFCRHVHRAPGLRFLQGDAEELPLFDASADAVINVEASFCYGNIDRFFSEVHRVLRPGGHFLYTDLRHVEEIDGVIAGLQQTGLHLVKMEDITDNVLHALTLDAKRRAAVAQMNLPWFFKHAMRTFAGAPGTRIPTLLSEGRMRYFCCSIRKPLENESLAIANGANTAGLEALCCAG